MRLASIVIPCVLAAGAGWWLTGLTLGNGPRPAYDHQVAYQLAGLRVPAHRNEYFMFDLNSETDPAAQAGELAQNLGTINDEHQYIGLIGADGAHNRAVLRRAAALAGATTYPDVTLIVVGRPGEKSAFRRLAAPLGATFVYEAYP